MEKLSKMISAAVDSKGWEPIQLSRNAKPLSHLFIADDILLFSRASQNSCEDVRQTLSSFASISGLQASSEISSWIASKPMFPAECSQVTSWLTFPQVTQFGHYLGFSITLGRTENMQFEYIIETIRGCLNGWCTKFLNKAGRITLTTLLGLSSIPAYAMQIGWIPQNVCDIIDQWVR